MIPNINDLAQEYIDNFASLEIRVDKLSEVQDFVAHILAGQPQYEEVEKTTSVPWFVVSIIHGLEGSFNFHTHLHNGDPLHNKTVNVPKYRPPGDPPFTWLESAEDALKYDGFTTWTRWDVPGILYKIESYNGWGYHNREVVSPYLWSYSNLYEKGKYSSDGHYDPNLVSKQVGAGTALKFLTSKHIVALKAVEAA